MEKNPLGILPENDVRDEKNWEESPILQWLFEYGKYLLITVFVFLLVVFTFSRFFASTEKEYGEANQAYLLLQKNPADKAPLANLESILKKEPALHPKYDGFIAQEMLNLNEIEKAKHYGSLVFSRTEGQVDEVFTAYGDISFLVGEKKYSEALTKAKELQLRIERKEPKENFQLLKMYNLFRIGALQNALGLKEDELKTWQEFKKHNESKDLYIQNVVNSFEEGKITLKNFINQRENSLRK